MTKRPGEGRAGAWAVFKAGFCSARQALPRTLELAGLSCELTVREHPRAKHVRLKVLPPGRVEVVVPPGYDRRGISPLLVRHEAWLARTVHRLCREWAARPEPSPPEVIDLAALGEQWRLAYRASPSGRTLCREDGRAGLAVQGPDQAAWRIAVRRWLARRAKAALLPWLASTSGALGLAYAPARVRRPDTPLGRCTARGTISLNHALLFLPPPLVRYLFVHELCHTRHLNHSARFWALVREMEPRYRDYENELRLATQYVPRWLRGG